MKNQVLKERKNQRLLEKENFKEKIKDGRLYHNFHPFFNKITP